MKKERLTELLKTFEHGISHAPGKGLDLVLEYQDIIGQATNQDITEYYTDLDQSKRKHFLWACFMTLSEDMATDIMVNTTLKLRMEKEYDELDKHFNEEWSKVRGRENMLAVNEAKLEAQIDKLTVKVNTQHETIKELKHNLYTANAIVERHIALIDSYA